MTLFDASDRLAWVRGLAGALFDALAEAPHGPAVRSRPEMMCRQPAGAVSGALARPDA